MRSNFFKIVTIIGARPQFIKASVLSKVLIKFDNIKEIIINTGQHFDECMAGNFFHELEIPEPSYNLGIHGGSHGAMTGQMIIEIEKILLKEKPDAVIVYGDTNSTLAASLASAKLNIPIAHIEAGLRSFNKYMPEEINRILTDHVSNWLFTPTLTAYNNLINEGLDSNKIFLVGDVMYDLVLERTSEIDTVHDLYENFGLINKKYILLTVHRQENTDSIENLTNIISASNEIASKIPVVWPIHPRTKNALHQLNLLNKLNTNLKIIEPVGYTMMGNLQKNSALIITDSGGVQKESYFHRIQCLTLRNETEWTELVDSGWNTLISVNNASDIVETAFRIMGKNGHDIDLYGSGDAGQKIVNIICNALMQDHR